MKESPRPHARDPAALFFAFGLCAALLLASCAGGPPPASQKAQPASPAGEAGKAGATGEAGAASKAGAAGRLASALRPPSGWAELPAEAQVVAEEFRRRMAAKEWDWLLSRADPSFTAAYPGGARGDKNYLARLIWSGGLATGAPDEGRGFSSLEPGSVKSVRFEEVSLKGPVLILYGRLALRGGGESPFALHILWRLEPPLLVGAGP